MSKMGSHHPFEHLKHKLWPKERPRVKLAIWLPTIKSWELTRFPCVQATCDILGKLLMRATTLLKTSLPSEVCTRSYAPSKLQKSQPWEFRDSHLGVSWQKAIWMWPPWRATKYTIRGKVVACPKFEPWWILCVQVTHGSF
jgi:hypothetical protein